MLGLLSKPFTYCLPLSLPLLILLRQSLTHYEPNWSWIWDPALDSWILRLKMHATTLCKVHSFKTMSHTSIVMKWPLGKRCRHNQNRRIPRSVFPRSLWRAPNLHFSPVLYSDHFFSVLLLPLQLLNVYHVYSFTLQKAFYTISQLPHWAFGTR